MFGSVAMQHQGVVSMLMCNTISKNHVDILLYAATSDYFWVRSVLGPGSTLELALMIRKKKSHSEGMIKGELSLSLTRCSTLESEPCASLDSTVELTLIVGMWESWT